jgi:hypothetical protein
MIRIILRLLLFSLSFYYVLEKMYTCEIKNEIAYLLLLSCMLLAVIVFINTKDSISQCLSCKQLIGSKGLD